MMNEPAEIGIHTGKSSKTTLIRAIEIMVTQLAKFTFENRASVEKLVDVEKQTKNYRMNLDQLQNQVQKLDEHIARATPLIGRLKKDHEMYKEQFQEAKKQMLNFQLSVNNEETAIHDLQTRTEMQKKHIQSIITKIGKVNKATKNSEIIPKVKEKKKKTVKTIEPTIKTTTNVDIQGQNCAPECPGKNNKVKTKQSISTEYHYRK